MKSKLLKLTFVIAVIVCVTLALTSCSDAETWKNPLGFTEEQLKLPDFADAGSDAGSANKEGWYNVMDERFQYSSVKDMEENSVWTTSPHAIRWESNNGKDYENNYWCPDMVSFKEGGGVDIKSVQTDSHKCSTGNCPSTGRFTSGIETRRVKKGEDNKGNSDELLFAQAFGYFEARVKFPNAKGLWSAFWLQSSNQRKLANEGVDGTEIDIYESAFINNPTNMGHALLWNGYGVSGYSKVDGLILDTDKNLYEGYHTFALKWTPEYYVFYIDGVPTWASNGGGVSKVKEFLRLTVEIDAGDTYGPHGQKIGAFKAGIEPIFSIDYVKVYQNKNYSAYEIPDDMFPGDLDMNN